MRPSTEEIVMLRPDRCAIIAGSAARMARYVPLRFTSASAHAAPSAANANAITRPIPPAPVITTTEPFRRTGPDPTAPCGCGATTRIASKLWLPERGDQSHKCGYHAQGGNRDADEYPRVSGAAARTVSPPAASRPQSLVDGDGRRDRLSPKGGPAVPEPLGPPSREWPGGRPATAVRRRRRPCRAGPLAGRWPDRGQTPAAICGRVAGSPGRVRGAHGPARDGRAGAADEHFDAGAAARRRPPDGRPPRSQHDAARGMAQASDPRPHVRRLGRRAAGFPRDRSRGALRGGRRRVLPAYPLRRRHRDGRGGTAAGLGQRPQTRR